jgi:hypothetical protein
MGAEQLGACMKPIWMWVIFIVVYGLFSMKTQAAELLFHGALLEDGCARYLY